MQRYPTYTRDRLAALTRLMREKIYAQTRPVDELLVSERTDRISYAAAQELTSFRPVRLGETFGPLWATYWFRAKVQVPQEWKGKRVDLLWISHSEATLWVDGRSVQGLNHEPTSWDKSTRPDAVLIPSARGGEALEFQVEMACNKVFGEEGERLPGLNPFSLYYLEQASIALFDELAWDLFFDFSFLQALEAEQLNDLDKAWGGLLLAELNRVANIYDPSDRSTWAEAQQILKALYRNTNPPATHELSAVGHAHIDTAWLWPLAETDRKCERTFSSATTYMESYPEFKFACSQAYQYDAVKRRNPDLYERIRKRVKSGQFIPVGGTWIEPDCNIPSGEALCRQFLFGQRYFQREFGITCKEFWNPDVFGYNGQLPQICNQAGIKRFLTQKLSWNRFNKPHHHTFVWEGIDGSEVFTHFPPADTYNAVATVKQLRDNARDYKDHDRSRHSLMLFGHGDGGGGPTKAMLEQIRRAKDLQGLPRTTLRHPDEFFDLLEQDNTDRARQIGELYFEYHRGTYTTQAATKRGNRKSEFLLHDVEFLCAMAMFSASPTGAPSPSYPADDINELWKIVLLNQFHDILPGSSIKLVYDDAAEHYQQVSEQGAGLRDAAAGFLVGGKGAKSVTPVNTIGFARREVAKQPDGTLVYVEAPSYGIGRVTTAPDAVKLTRSKGQFVLENAHLKAQLDDGGNLVSLIEKLTGRETLASAGNQFLIYVDSPVTYDAWDVDPFHMEQESVCPPAHSAKVVSESPLRAEIAFERKVGLESAVRQRVRLDANARHLDFDTEVDWHESKKMLKVAFPVNVRAMNATYEMQFGNAERPTHFNTPYDLARYEVPGHKWSDLSEHGFGVSLLSESKYGYSTFGNTMRLSLLRATHSPDPKADRGVHRFSYAIMPHKDGWREAGTVAEGYRFNCPIVWADGSSAASTRSFASIDDPNLVIDTIKKAEDTDQIVLRLYECHGARGVARLRVDAPFKSAVICNVLEEEQRGLAVRDGFIEVPYAPYKVIGIKLK